ncbi:MAG TPA: winged helix-turn-helix domain-containing protein [Nitrososphaeraceae archaeon]|nr:winged helix-turn-helix domain-containing protein [Nitrososphaeraceae archaeon]
MKPGRQTEIIQIILETITSREEGITKTQLMYKSFMSYIQLVEHLTVLRRSGLIEYNPSTSTYKTTTRGLRLLQVTKEINKLVTNKI